MGEVVYVVIYDKPSNPMRKMIYRPIPAVVYNGLGVATDLADVDLYVALLYQLSVFVYKNNQKIQNMWFPSLRAKPFKE